MNELTKWLLRDHRHEARIEWIGLPSGSKALQIAMVWKFDDIHRAVMTFSHRLIVDGDIDTLVAGKVRLYQAEFEKKLRAEEVTRQ